jgi:hypothetical protein
MSPPNSLDNGVMDHPSHEQTALRAYEIWQARGATHGGHEADWYQAEQELWTEKDNPLAGAARKVGTALGTAVAFINEFELMKLNS